MSYSPVSQSKLQFAPQWILYKSIEKERDNYKQEEAYEEVDVRDPRNTKRIEHHLITSFFQVKKDGDDDNQVELSSSTAREQG